MADATKSRKPGDIILDRYMPGATDSEREEARENLNNLVRVYVELIREAIEEGRRDPPRCDSDSIAAGDTVKIADTL